MKRLIIFLFITTGLLIAGCSSGNEDHSHGEGADHSNEQTTEASQSEQEHTHDEGEEQHEQGQEAASESEGVQREGSGAVTQWTDETELFMEYPEIIVGQEATFAVHLTRLSDFTPMADSEVYFTFRSENGAEISARETEVQVPGIYGPNITFEQAGRYDLTIEIYGMVNDTLQVNDIPVYNSADEVPHTYAEEDPNLITFLKEQQWDIPFATQEVQQRTLTQTIDATGEIMAAQNSQAVVAAPFSGIILSSQNGNLPVVGQQLQKGASMAVLNPAIQSGQGDNYAQQFINAQSELELAEANLERSRRLYKKEAIPQTELQKARIEYRQALTRYQTISEVIQIETTNVDSYGDSQQSYRFELKAPINGTILESNVTPGMQVEAGQPLYRIANASNVWLKANVPAARQNRIANASQATFRVQGDDRLYEVSELGGRLISRTNSIDPQSRTLSLIYELDNTQNGLPLGMFSTVHINTETKENVLAIPQSALIEEEGNYNVYVHVSGESFRQQRVTIGIEDRGWVEITSGLQGCEHVVTKNAYQVKLASLSSEAPAHGHTH
ncbi:efflux RND transporter periplasmic adaptor subunit [Aliifodinibius sp. S!AR15-10]|uniref:efflux RND transporter periplasmic adaptor subunit n=1 Tax=Aliifodinibius sp. S!AR15-10 TaxID=2950437 RepID=UPI002866EEE6|nr:efflux RND transporter periplasmic adaptor subunit [Aliifodinibius sp. S!AR15-10]MDR8393159.1 efflux RND transporter periplasmic adaptor subunit [Aliifodinibius sp. S!AR15-10]